jgi:hypothetical protein
MIQICAPGDDIAITPEQLAKLPLHLQLIIETNRRELSGCNVEELLDVIDFITYHNLLMVESIRETIEILENQR